MKILFAAPDRDLLECCKKLLEDDFGEVVTAFDGTQVLSLLSSEKFDAAILDEAIPRIGFEKLIARMRETELPVIGLINEPISVHRLVGENVANAYISYPFNVEDLAKKIGDTVEKAASGEKFDFFGLEIDVARFRMTGGPYLTAKETDVLKSLLNGETLTDDEGAQISALNLKLSGVGSKTTITYIAKKGFETVTRDE